MRLTKKDSPLIQNCGLRVLLLAGFPHDVDLLRLQTKAGVDGNVLARAIGAVDHDAMLDL